MQIILKRIRKKTLNENVQGPLFEAHSTAPTERAKRISTWKSPDINPSKGDLILFSAKMQVM